ncbi:MULTISPECIES: DUF362 domain-containing protein [unclassified Frankia]|uniref:DUF362 domain-containing protein n=1 Tax=unclassified Frankia TaxID=2632575 RepID=UPI001EF6196A|nr:MULTISPECIES: DUF362 domain-containing protein [unclassified Frankia]
MPEHVAQYQVSVTRTEVASYPDAAPFSPDTAYPEYTHDHLSPSKNPVYSGVRRVLALAGMDAAYVETARWNPLGDFVGPGGTVVLKPNLVRERHPRDSGGWRYILTHGSVVRAVADYAFTAVGPTGRVVVADAPQTDSSFSAIMHILGMDDLQRFYRERGFTLDLIDLRKEEWTTVDDVVVARHRLVGDPGGEMSFDLAAASEFVGHSGTGRYYGADYDSRVVNFHHRGGRHAYLLSGTVMRSDLVVNLPKLKSHKKAGITLGLKNLVGVNADKNWLPHHTEGRPDSGGDEHPSRNTRHSLERAVATKLQRVALAAPRLGGGILRVARRGGSQVFGDGDSVVRSGNWWGNDTVWRMCLDLNKIVEYGRADGTVAHTPDPNRRHIVLVDGVIAGHRNGPMNPDALPSRLLACGTIPAAVDAVVTYLFGFDPDRVPVVRQAFMCRSLPLASGNWREIQVVSDHDPWNVRLGALPVEVTLHAEPHFAWKGHIEHEPRTAVHR